MVLVIVTDTGHTVGVIANDKRRDCEYILSMVAMNNEYYGCECELKEVWRMMYIIKKSRQFGITTKWHKYEAEKRKIIAQNLSAEKYTRAIRQLCDKLKV